MKNKIVLLITVAAMTLILVLSGIFIILHMNRLKSQLMQSNAMCQKVASELERAEKEKDKISAANEKLQADTVSYLAVNAKLIEDKEGLAKKIEDAQEKIEKKESSIERMQKRLNEMENKVVSYKTYSDQKLMRDKKGLEKKMYAVQKTLKNERALYHYNLGVAYSQAKLYDEAADAYEKSVTFNPDNADAHYNLALLYETVQTDPEKAVAHYQRYLELEPDTLDRDEVEGRINRLK
jgi:tetratricopeptide (TPR) repeat protein